MDAQDLFDTYRFVESAALYEQQLAKGIGNPIANKGGLAAAFMAIGRYADAMPLLEEVGEYEKRRVRGSAGQDDDIAVCRWICGDRAGALEMARALVRGVGKGTVQFAPDLAGGVSYGVLLYYMALSLPSQPDIDLSLSFLRGRTKAKKSSPWPMPVAQFLLGQLIFPEMLAAGFGTPSLDRVKRSATNDLLTLRQLTNALFAMALHCRAAGDEAECLKWFNECAGLVNPLIEPGWHLAKAEVARSGQAR